MSAVASVFTGQAGSSFDGFTIGQKTFKVFVKVTASGNYAGAPGDPLDLTALGDFVKSGYTPLYAEFESQNPAGSSGYWYVYIPGTTIANGTFQVLKGAAGPNVDIGAGAYPAGVTGDTITGWVEFVKQ